MRRECKLSQTLKELRLVLSVVFKCEWLQHGYCLESFSRIAKHLTPYKKAQDPANLEIHYRAAVVVMKG